MIKLFDGKLSLNRWSRSNENTYDYFNNSNKKKIIQARNLLNFLFDCYPEEEKKELKARFKKDFDSSFYELFLYSFFLKLKCDLKIHPDLNKKLKKPDFLVSASKQKFYAEAKVCYDLSNDERKFEKLKNQFYDELNKLCLKNFHLGIEEIEFKTKKQPSTRALKNEIVKYINKLNLEEIDMLIAQVGHEGIQKLKYEDKDIYLTIRALPIDKSLRDKEVKRPIGMYPFESFWGGGEEFLKTSLIKKSKHYGKLNKPLILCLNTLGIRFYEGHDIEKVLFGISRYGYQNDKSLFKDNLFKSLDGLFFNESYSMLKNVSAVLITKIYPFNVPFSDYSIYINPNSTHKINFAELGLNHNFLVDGEMRYMKGISLDDIFKNEKKYSS